NLIVPVEQTDAGVDEVQIMGRGGDFVRPAGGDVHRGDEVVEAGVRLSARHIASAASAGHGRVSVYPKPRVAVISTGSELKAPGEALEFGQIPNSNSAMVAASLAHEAHVVDYGAVADEAHALKNVLDSVEADAVILTGGVSVGAYDVVKELLATQPGMWFGPVAMQPGKPQGFGTYRGMSVFTLPGNPVSVYVSLHMLVRPALAHMCGAGEVRPSFRTAVAGEGWGCPPARVQFIPVRVKGQDDEGRLIVVPASSGGSGSHLIGTLARAEGLARVEADVDEVVAGDRVLFWEER
ncbi:MAG TPA: molybdopterin molybdotransferase MoeA, partial [Beutenbergiaceae bacterium]|nr:molybdopterin molybdotransferase MoeA [Beutenbergiaceae bacterium]